MPEPCPVCVLLVDDDSSMRGLLAWQLAKAGFDAIHAEDGIDAVVKLRDTLPGSLFPTCRCLACQDWNL
jgi:DNA-binding response OmpR family regulator